MRYFIHPDNPQPRLIQQVVMILQRGGIIAYPTDVGYALACQLSDTAALERLCHIKKLTKHHLFTLICRDLSELALHARVDNWAFRLLKRYTPGAYTFVLKATKSVPKRLIQQKRQTIGLRIPGTPIIQALLEENQAPILSTTLAMTHADTPIADPDILYETIHTQIDGFVDGGSIVANETSIIDLSGEAPEILRQGAGDIHPFE